MTFRWPGWLGTPAARPGEMIVADSGLLQLPAAATATCLECGHGQGVGGGTPTVTRIGEPSLADVPAAGLCHMMTPRWLHV